MCTVNNNNYLIYLMTALIIILLLIFHFRIIFMFVYMLTMFCHLSQVNPSLHPYLKFQPWCSLCSSSDYPTTTGSAHQQAVEELSMLSKLLLPTTTDSNDHGSSASASSFRSPRPSVLPTTWFVNQDWLFSLSNFFLCMCHCHHHMFYCCFYC